MATYPIDVLAAPRGRNRAGFYSTLAGFLEPGESFEEAVTREIWEESGIHVTNVRYHSCQVRVVTATDTRCAS